MKLIKEIVIGDKENSGIAVLKVSPSKSVQTLSDLKINQKLRIKNGVLCVDSRPGFIRFFSEDNRDTTLKAIENIFNKVSMYRTDILVYQILKEALTKLKTTYKYDMLWAKNADNLIHKINISI